MSGPAVGAVGVPHTFTLTAADPSAADQAAGFSFAIDWDGDGVTDQTVTGPSGITVAHAFADDDAYDDPAIYAAYAACHAAEATYASPYAAADAAYDAANATATAYGAYAPELRRLVSVIARSLQTFPVLLTAPG